MSKKVKEEKIIDILRMRLDDKRYQHCLGVQETARRLAVRYGVNKEKAVLAGLVHDWAKGLTASSLLVKAEQFGIPIDDICLYRPDLLHGPVGAELIEQELGIVDQEIKRAVYQHTLGAAKMSLLTKIIFVADYIEPSRDYPGVETIRKAAWDSLDLAVFLAAEQTIKYLLSKEELIHPQTVITRNAFLLLVNKNNGRR